MFDKRMEMEPEFDPSGGERDVPLEILLAEPSEEQASRESVDRIRRYVSVQKAVDEARLRDYARVSVPSDDDLLRKDLLGDAFDDDAGNGLAVAPLAKADATQRFEEFCQAAPTDPHARRLVGLIDWLRSQLALGKSVESLIAHAARHDLRTANDLREAATLLEAA